MIVVLSGPPCSGESMLGEILSRTRAMTHLEMDAIRPRLRPEAAHTREDRAIAYRAMHLTAEVLAARGESVIANASALGPWLLRICKSLQDKQLLPPRTHIK